jgi:hypothetical protein
LEIRVFTSLWGNDFADIFLKYSLPSLLSYGNCQRVLAAGHHIIFYIYSDTATLVRLRSSEVTTPTDGKEFKFFDMSETFFDGKPLDYEIASQAGLINTHELQSRCYMHGMEHSIANGIAFLFWTADAILSDGALNWGMRQLENGSKAIYADVMEIKRESAANDLDRSFGRRDKGISGRTLADILLNHTHQNTLDHFYDDGAIISYPSFLFSLSRDGSFIHTGIFPHPLLVLFDGRNTRFESSIDYEFAQRVVGDNPYEKAIDSDDLLLCTITSGKGYGPLKRIKLSAEVLANFLIHEANRVHFELAQKISITHVSGINAVSDVKKSQMALFLEEVHSELISIGNSLDLTNLEILMAAKSFFGPVNLYASPQRQNINKRWIKNDKT